MQRFVITLAFAAASAWAVIAQTTVRDFLPAHSTVSEQGSKVRLVFQRFTSNLSTISVDAEDLDDCNFEISYPTYGDSLQRDNRTVACRRVVAENDEVIEQGQPIQVTVFVCHLDGDIHDSDQIESPIDLLAEGWGHNTNSSEVTGIVDDRTPDNDPGSDVDYPKPIVSWDMVPHQIYADPFHVDLVVLHRYSFEHSEYGDARVEVWIDGNVGGGEPPTTGPKLVATARPSYKVPQRTDIHAGTYLTYRATFDPEQYLDGSNIVDGPAYVHFKITPSRGDADSILVSTAYDDENVWRPDLAVLGVQPNIETMKVFMNGGRTLNTNRVYAVVDPSAGDDESGVVSTSIPTARANPFKSIYRAAQAIVAFDESAVNRFILMREGKAWSGKAPDDDEGDDDDLQGEHWLNIEPDSADGVERADVELTDIAFTLSSTADLNPLFKIINDSGVPLEWRWQDGDNEGLVIRHKTNGQRNYDVLLSREGLTVTQMVLAIHEDDDLDMAGVTAEVLDFGNLSVDPDDIYYDPATAFVEIADTAEGNVLANHICRTGSGVYVFAEMQEKQYSGINFPTVGNVVDNGEEGINRDFEFTTAVAERPDLLQSLLKVEAARIPKGFAEGEEVWFSGDIDNNGWRYPYVRYFDCTIRSTRLKSNDPEDGSQEPIQLPAHLWLDQCEIVHESKASVDTAVIVAIPTSFKGGGWFTRCNWNTVNKASNGPVMVRDAWFRDIGGDTGKQVSYACNWFAENVAEIPDDPVHPDYFQWSPDALQGKNTHGNIIAVNLDFRDADNDGQPFLFNVPGNNNTTHKYTGIALVNLRMDAARTQQICGNADHLLIWDSDVFQDSVSSRRVQLRGVPNTPQGNPHTSIYHNISIRNTVVERIRINGESNDQFPGDMPSLWAILDSCQITTELFDEGGDVSTLIDAYPGTQDGSSPGALVDLDTDWSPLDENEPTLRERLISKQIVYRLDAAGKERVIDDEDPLGAVGAMEDPDQSDGQPCELDWFDIEVGSLSTAGVPDDNPLSTLVLSDDRKLSVLSAGLSPVVELFVVAKTRVASPATIDLVFEGRLTSGTMTNGAKLALWDWNAMPPAWVDQDTFTISTTESVRTKTGITPTNYIEAGTGMIKYRLRLAPLNWINPDFTVQADQMKIVVKD